MRFMENRPLVLVLERDLYNIGDKIKTREPSPGLEFGEEFI